MTQDELREQARYMLDTRTVNTIGEYLWLWRDRYLWGAILWIAALAVVLLTAHPIFAALSIGFVFGWLVSHFLGLRGLAKQNEIIEAFTDWSKVQAAAGRHAEHSATKS